MGCSVTNPDLFGALGVFSLLGMGTKNTGITVKYFLVKNLITHPPQKII